MDFRYLAQARVVDSNLLEKISGALQEFHEHKSSILDAGARVGAKKKPIDHFQIPKLELLQGVVPSIRWAGAAAQWAADVTEHAHVTEIKIPARSGNNRGYDPQICRYLDRAEKRRNFDLATAIREEWASLHDSSTGEGMEEEADTFATPSLSTTDLDTVESLAGPTQPPNFFFHAQLLLNMRLGETPLPFRTFSSHSVAFHLNYNPHIRRMSIDEVASRFGLPDLRLALADYISTPTSESRPIGGRRCAQGYQVLPFNDLQVWHSIRIQNTSVLDCSTLPPRTVCAFPPSEHWPHGRYDTAIVSNNQEDFSVIPGVGLPGMLLAPLIHFTDRSV
jgi:hypothetical protein